MSDAEEATALKGVEQSTTLQGIPPERPSPLRVDSDAAAPALSVETLTEQCRWEIQAYRRGELSDDTYGLELLYRAIMQGDQDAWTGFQQCLEETVLTWLHEHPSREAACRGLCEKHVVAQAFERFQQATTSIQRVECTTLADALVSLRASLHGAILDRHRANERPRESLKPVRGQPEEAHVENVTSNSEVWEMVKGLLANAREQRLAYLLFHCGLSPRGIVRSLPQEWSDVQEIARLRRTIMERLLCHADQLGLVPHSCDPDGRSMVL